MLHNFITSKIFSIIFIGDTYSAVAIRLNSIVTLGSAQEGAFAYQYW